MTSPRRTRNAPPPAAVARRGELMAELFLEGLSPAFVGRNELTGFDEFDFFVGFRNDDGGFNTFPVEVLATAEPVGETGRHGLPRSQFESLANSSPPALLLVADAVRSELFYAWPDRVEPDHRGKTCVIPVAPAKADREAILARLTEPPGRAVVRAGGESPHDLVKAAA